MEYKIQERNNENNYFKSSLNYSGLQQFQPQQFQPFNFLQPQQPLQQFQPFNFLQPQLQQPLQQLQPQQSQQIKYLQPPWQQEQYIDPRESIDLKLIKKPKKKDKRCYTCKPRGKVKHHVINTSGSGNFVFHHDMHKRPVIIVTPVKHVEQIHDLNSQEINDLFISIKDFCELWNIKDYQISINVGSWQEVSNSHLHCKIRLPEKLINRMRRDHFEKIKLDKRYNERSE